MHVQPQLVLLQKTLFNVEGLGRQLYPDLDLWATAKPFLEKWLKDQVGPRALLRKIRRNIPYWTEKLPDIPDLLYQTLVDLHEQKRWRRQQELVEPARIKSKFKNNRWRLLIGLTLVLFAIFANLPASILVNVTQWHSLLIGALGVLGLFLLVAA